MEIVKIGYHHSHDDFFQIRRENGSGNYLLLLVFTPSQMVLNGEAVVMTAPFFIFYRQDTPQLYGAYQGEYMDDWIHLTLSESDLLVLEELRIPMDTPVALEDLEELSDLVRQITYEFHGAGSRKRDNLHLYLRILFNRIGEHFHTPSQSPHFSVLNRIRGLMYNEPYREYGIEALAREAGLSRSSLSHLYKELFGVGVNEDLIRARMAYAMELLGATQLPVYQVAELCGYHSNIHFMRQFKERVGVTPSQYRRLDGNHEKDV